MVSESEFGVKGHGVHTAYVEMANSLKKLSYIELFINKTFKKADIVHIQTMWPFGLFMLRFARGKKVVSAHIVAESLIGSFRGAEKLRWFTDRYLKYFYKKANLILAVSEKVKQSLVDDLGVDEAKIVVFYNTIDTSLYSRNKQSKRLARHELNISENEFVVVGNGQVQPRKRFDIFIDMAKKLPETKFIWIGGIPFKHLGADYQAMQEMIAKVPGNLKVTGIIPLEDVKKYLFAGDIFILPAEQENHPLAVLEAAASGLPIVLRDIPEYDDTFKNDIVRVKDNKFADAVTKLSKDKVYFSQYSKKAALIAKRFDSKASAKRLAGYYEAIIRR